MQFFFGFERIMAIISQVTLYAHVASISITERFWRFFRIKLYRHSSHIPYIRFEAGRSRSADHLDVSTMCNRPWRRKGRTTAHTGDRMKSKARHVPRARSRGAAINSLLRVIITSMSVAATAQPRERIRRRDGEPLISPLARFHESHTRPPDTWRISPLYTDYLPGMVA